MEKELYHWGIKGMSWGHRNGPPYPLDYGSHSLAEKRKMKKSLKIKAQNLEKAREAKAVKAEETKARESTRERLLKDGTAAEILNNKDLFSQKELNELYNKLQTESNIRRLAEADAAKQPKEKTRLEKVETTVNNIKRGADAVSKAIDVYDFVAKTFNNLTPEDSFKLKVINDKTVKAKKLWNDFMKDQDFNAFYKEASKLSASDLQEMSKKMASLKSIKEGNEALNKKPE